MAKLSKGSGIGLESARGVIRAGLNAKGQPYDPIFAPQFPGFDSDSPFECRIDIDPRHCETLTGITIERAISHDAFTDRVRAMLSRIEQVGLFCRQRSPLLMLSLW